MPKMTQALNHLMAQHQTLIERPNKPASGNGVLQRWQFPILTREHTPVFWRYDLDPLSNPHSLERQGINATFNSGALLWQGLFTLVVRVEGNDRKSFFAVAQSPNGLDNFRFWDYPIDLPQTDDPDVNVYDMRLTQHDDGYIYGLFCTERKDRAVPADTSAATAQCGIVRTRDLKHWERLPDLVTASGQQRNVVLHPQWVAGQYGFYTRPQEGFISVGAGGGIGWGLSPSMEGATIAQEHVLDPKQYHTVQEVKNGQGPPPIKTAEGWLHLAHGVRATAAGLRYVLYLFLTDLQEPWRVLYKPAGHVLAPLGPERVGDVSNVVFSNGWICTPGGEVYIYYASSDTRMHVATSRIEYLLDYVKNTPADGNCSAASVAQRNQLIAHNLAFLSR